MEGMLEGVERTGVAEGVDGDARRVVSHAAPDARLDGYAVDPGPKTHALHRAADPDAFPIRNGSHDVDEVRGKSPAMRFFEDLFDICREVPGIRQGKNR